MSPGGSDASQASVLGRFGLYDRKDECFCWKRWLVEMSSPCTVIDTGQAFSVLRANFVGKP